ncbi:MAG: SIR2 family protein [Alphaproteobacteria bacterium]
MSSSSSREEIILKVQSIMKKEPLIILGSGASCAHDIPSMAVLGENIFNCFPNEIKESEEAAWNRFTTDESYKKNLEKALSEANFSEEAKQEIIKICRKTIAEADRMAYQSLRYDKNWPLKKLLEYVFDSTKRAVDILTTNYDCLAEYAARAAGYRIYTAINKIEPSKVFEMKSQRCQQLKTVNIWKVHGSIDWFLSREKQYSRIPLQLEPFDGDIPLIIPPHSLKYQKTHEEPYRSIITKADSAIENASGFLCIGFGFNDSHIQEKLIQACQNNSKPIILLTKDLTDNAQNFLNGCNNYFAFTNHEDTQTKIRSSSPEDFLMPDTQWWRLSEFISILS